MNGHVLLVSCDLQKSVNGGLHSLVTLGGRGKKLSLGESKSGIICNLQILTIYFYFVMFLMGTDTSNILGPLYPITLMSAQQ